MLGEPFFHQQQLSDWTYLKWGQQNIIKLHLLHGEEGSVDVSTLQDQRKSLRELLREYIPSDVLEESRQGCYFIPSRARHSMATLYMFLWKIRRESRSYCASRASTRKTSPLVINLHQNPRGMKGIDR
uniref:Uncharacterized protein n=1 Tax=Hyaloperonospora arabidopsidis (strain Emoy2) TaxID=559515 RepID=M4B5T1_HYAAE